MPTDELIFFKGVETTNQGHTVSYVWQKTWGHTVSYEYYEWLDWFKGTFAEHIPSGELTVCNGKSPFLMGKSTINGHFQLLFVCSPEGKRFLGFFAFISFQVRESACRLNQLAMSTFWRVDHWHPHPQPSLGTFLLWHQWQQLSWTFGCPSHWGGDIPNTLW